MRSRATTKFEAKQFSRIAFYFRSEFMQFASFQHWEFRNMFDTLNNPLRLVLCSLIFAPHFSQHHFSLPRFVLFFLSFFNPLRLKKEEMTKKNEEKRRKTKVPNSIHHFNAQSIHMCFSLIFAINSILMVRMLCNLIEFSETFSRPNNRINIDRNASFLSFCLEVMMLARDSFSFHFLSFRFCSLVHHFTYSQRTMLSIMFQIYDANLYIGGAA